MHVATKLLGLDPMADTMVNVCLCEGKTQTGVNGCGSWLHGKLGYCKVLTQISTLRSVTLNMTTYELLGHFTVLVYSIQFTM